MSDRTELVQQIAEAWKKAPLVDVNRGPGEVAELTLQEIETLCRDTLLKTYGNDEDGTGGNEWPLYPVMARLMYWAVIYGRGYHNMEKTIEMAVAKTREDLKI